ncbi:MAG: PaaI family thioesterase [Anaerovorax sp.]
MIKTNDAEKEQIRMEQEAQASIAKIFVVQAGQINAMMEPKYIGCHYANREIMIEFPVKKWQLNRVGVMHGGMIATAFDIALEILARFEVGLNFSPTIDMETTFLKPIRLGDDLVVTAKILSSGRTITHLQAEAYLKKGKKLAAVARSSYMNVDIAIK